MWQEWAATTPFLYFTDHDPDVGRLVSEGRREEFSGFSGFTDRDVRARIPDPQSSGTFHRSRLDWDEAARPGHAEALALTRAMLHLRRDDPVLRARARSGLRASAHGDALVVSLRVAGDERWVVVNFGAAELAVEDLGLPAVSVLVASAPPGDGAGGPRLPPESAVVLAPAPA